MSLGKAFVLIEIGQIEYICTFMLEKSEVKVLVSGAQAFAGL
jgi:hypothetical protein